MRVLIVDDHQLFCDSLKLLLHTLGIGSEVRTCGTAKSAVDHLRDGEWDLVLLDWNLGVKAMSGLDLVREVKVLAPTTRVVVVSADSSSDRVRSAVEAGAVGFVPKEASSDLLIDAIRITSHGGIYLPLSVLSEVTADGDGTFVPTAYHHGDDQATLTNRYPSLTPRQSDVLAGVVRGQSNKQIARALDISDNTVKQHLNSVYRELGVNSRTEAIYLLARQGIKVF